MPVINFRYSDLCSLLGQMVPHDVLIERIPLIGADMHQTEGECEEMSVEFFPDRPDLFSVEGLARALRAFLGIEPGLKKYCVNDSDYAAAVDPSVLGVRPFFACAVVKDLEVSDDLIRSVMELQEKLHMTIGRKRSKLAIGIHDLDKVSPPFRYTAVRPDEISFVPLNHTERMDLKEILISHDKGKEYAHLLDGKEKYPIIFDRNGNVLSFPPIINGALTAVTAKTRNVFIDVTGNDRKAVKGALDIVTTALAERGGKIFKVNIEGYGHSPDLTETLSSLSMRKCNRFLGISLDKKGIEESVRKMGMNVSVSGDDVTVSVPSTRLDIMHKVDIFEDVAIGYGFERFGGPYSSIQTMGKSGKSTSISDKIRDIMIGLGFTEVTTLTLSNQEDEFEISGLPAKTSTCITNPITEDHTCLRSYLMPSLMKILRHNRHRDLPQKIFEVGFVSEEHLTVPHLCGMMTASKTPFTEIKSITDAVAREMNIEHGVSVCGYRTFVDGRGAFISLGNRNIGFFGEVSPEVVTDYGITHPVAMFEIDLSEIIGEKTGSLF
ncbi:MAG: phenylalanine--tRNA ligase subunit beta [Candidatus Methanoplasma sp.]|jgi:phenylalanyl-tRNA synthetase beta chain|nr:phenylalanine--tRNA ligase subunit beta [Candidatus Methanoplasma sp.]